MTKTTAPTKGSRNDPRDRTQGVRLVPVLGRPLTMLRTTETTLPHVAIRASAGTGKTFQLTNRFITLLLRGESPDRILATTFTRKAAGEILGRVLTRLAEAGRSPEGCARLAAQLGEPALDPPRALAMLVRLVHSLHRLRVCTLDSFFGALAGTFSMDVGLPPTWSIVTTDDDAALRDQALEALLDEQGTAQTVALMRTLGKGTPSQRVATLLRGTVDRLHGLFLEAPPEAWDVPPHAPPLDGHALAAAIDRVAALAIADKRMATGRDKDLDRFVSGLHADFLQAGLAKTLGDGTCEYYRKPVPPEVVDAYQPLLQHARATLLDLLGAQTRASYQLLDAFDRHYRRIKSRARALSFDDVTRALAVRAITGRLDEVYYRLDSRIAHLLLDEFQDTSRVQWQVLRPFAEEVVAHSDESRSFFCVGDVKQAIYGWRGGAAEIFESLGDELPTLVWQPLDTSRRSSPVIIDAVNRLFGTLSTNPALATLREGARRWEGGFALHTTARESLPGHVLVRAAAEASSGSTAEQQRVTLHDAAAHVASLYAASAPHSIGILVRTNAAVARMIFALRRLGIPASQEGGNALSDSPGVTLLLSLLTLADHPGDTAARFHVARSPLAPHVQLTRYDDASSARQLSLALRHALLSDGYGPTVQRYALDLLPHCDARDRNRLRQLVELAYAFQPEASLRVDDFLARVRAVRVDDPNAARVRVMTVHQAKGLEFDMVVLADLDARLAAPERSPMLVSRPSPAEPLNRVVRYASEAVCESVPELMAMRRDHQAVVTREALSVLYVAVTRAVHALHMVVAPVRPGARSASAPTAASVVRAALAHDVGANGVLFESGNASWYSGEFPRTDTDPVAGETVSPIAVSPDAYCADPDSPTRGLARITPTELEGAGGGRLADRLRLDDHGARERGLRVHAWMETIEWLAPGTSTLDRDALRRIARARGLGGVGLDATLDDFLEALAHPAVREVLTRETGVPPVVDGETVDVRREMPFAVRMGSVLMTGTFDRLVRVRNGGRIRAAEVVDFKTDEVRRGDRRSIAARVRFYQPQMQAYRRAAAKVTGLDPEAVRVRLVFVFAGQVVAV